MTGRLQRWYRRHFRPCAHCRNEGVVLHYGPGRFADVRNCSVCADGRWVADTIVPTASETRAA